MSIDQLFKDETSVSAELEEWVRELLLDRKALEARCRRAEGVIMVHAQCFLKNGLDAPAIAHTEPDGPDDFEYVEQAVQAFRERTEAKRRL